MQNTSIIDTSNAYCGREHSPDHVRLRVGLPSIARFAVRVGRHSEDNNLLCRLKSRPGGSTSANDESQTSLSRSGQQSAGTGASLLPPDGCGLAFKRVGGRQTSRFQISLSRTLLLTNVPALAGIISLPSSRTVSRKFFITSFSPSLYVNYFHIDLRSGGATR